MPAGANENGPFAGAIVLISEVETWVRGQDLNL